MSYKVTCVISNLDEWNIHKNSILEKYNIPVGSEIPDDVLSEIFTFHFQLDYITK